MPLTAEDRVNITELISRYCHATDSGNGAALADLFSSDGILERSGSWQARNSEAIAEIGSLPNKPKHLVNSVVIEGTGSTATSTASFAAIGPGRGLLGSGHLRSKLTKQRNGEWKFVHHCYEDSDVDMTGSQGGKPQAGSLTASDKVEIIELIARYSRAVDDRQPEAMADCCVDDYIYEVNETRVVGRKALIEKLSNAADSGDALHWTTNHVIEGTTNDAKGYIYLAVYNENAVAATAVYNDIYKKVNGDWRLVHRRVLIDRPSE